MSWSVGVTSLPPAEAAANIEKQFESSGPCVEPEESVRQSALKLIAESLAGITKKGVIVSVSAWGSQSTDYSSGEASNDLVLKIAPEWPTKSPETPAVGAGG